MREWIGRIAGAVSLMLSANSCTAMECDDYRHLAFGSAPDVTVLETRVPALSGLRDVKPFPVSYVLKRDGYQILARAYEKDYGPTAMLSVEAAAAKKLRATKIPTAADGSGCIVSVEQTGGVKFSWLGKPGCDVNQIIALAVIDVAGNQIASEEISFTVVKNGRFCVKDGL